MSCPSQAILGQNLTFYTQWRGGTGAPADPAATPTYSVYEDETGTAILSGTMAKLDDANTTGFYSEQIAITAANGFELWKSYTIRYAATVGGVSVAGIDTFNVVQTALSATTTSGALTTVANFKTYAGITGSDDDTLLTSLIARATSAIEAYCGQTLTSTTYREFYDGQGDCEIWLNATPVTGVQLLATGRLDIVSINNVNSDGWNAYANVDATNLELVVQGGTNDGTDTLTLADYTLSTLVTAINALGTGWTASLLISSYGTWEAAELLTTMGLSAFDTVTAYLQIPEDVKSAFRVDAESGRVYLSTEFPRGHENVIIRYTAGAATTPADLEQICIDLVNTYYRSRKRDTSVMAERYADHAVTYATTGTSGVSYRDIPESLQRRLAPYKKFRLSL